MSRMAVATGRALGSYSLASSTRCEDMASRGSRFSSWLWYLRYRPAQEAKGCETMIARAAQLALQHWGHANT